jgi:hypothetical protein
MHEGESCSQRRERVAPKAPDELKSLKLVAAISKPSPNCTSNIQKVDGCDHMTCECSMLGWAACKEIIYSTDPVQAQDAVTNFAGNALLPTKALEEFSPMVIICMNRIATIIVLSLDVSETALTSTM